MSPDVIWKIVAVLTTVLLCFYGIWAIIIKAIYGKWPWEY